MTLKKIVSGAQTGADIAGLEVAYEFGLETGGTMPFGFKTLNGCKPEYARIFGIKVHHSSSYVPRTKENVKNSDGTIRFAFDFESKGEKCTFRAIQDFKKPYFDVDLNDPPPVLDVIKWLEQEKIEILNVAGNSEQTFPGTHKETTDYLTDIMRGLGFMKRGQLPRP